MAEIRDLPGQLDVVLYVARPTTLTLTWPSTLAGKTFTCKVNYGDGVIHTYTPSIVTVTMTIVLTVGDYPAELTPGTIQIIETTGGLTTPIIAGRVTVTRGTGTSSTTATVTVVSSTVAVSIQTWATANPTFATVALRTAGIASPVAGNAAYLTTPKILTLYNGATWDGQVPTFTSTTTRDTAIPSPDTGMLVRLSGPETLTYYNGSAWVDVLPTLRGVVLVDSPQTYNTSVAADVTWTAAEVSDPDNWAAVGSATLTVPTNRGGRYTISFTSTWSANPGTQGAVACYINGTVVSEAVAAVTGIFAFTCTLTIVRTLAAGDTIKFAAWQNSGSNKDITSRLEIG